MIAAAEVLISCHQATDGAWACRPTSAGVALELTALALLFLIAAGVGALLAAHYEIVRKPKR